MMNRLKVARRMMNMFSYAAASRNPPAGMPEAVGAGAPAVAVTQI
jgi:hypothetical protein